jgi:hypothetical protein
MTMHSEVALIIPVIYSESYFSPLLLTDCASKLEFGVPCL